MSSEFQKRLTLLNADYERVAGSPCRRFFCPILYRDEDTELCRAHVINRSFRNSDRSWTIQRADVDAYYGSLFEAEFLAMQEKDRHQADEALADKDLVRQLKPKIVLDGEEVDYYFPQGHVPPEHSEATLFASGKTARLALKLPPADMLTVPDGKLEIHIDRNLQLPALASLLKVAHLTLFHLLGYRYALSASGHFLGKTVLGDFFLKTQSMGRASVLVQAESHFQEFTNMVRPILSMSPYSQGTLTDHFLYLCMRGSQPWALQVLIRTADHLYAVMVPIIDESEAAVRFVDFLKSSSSEIEMKLARWKGDAWEVSPKSEMHVWPEALFDAELPTT